MNFGVLTGNLVTAQRKVENWSLFESHNLIASAVVELLGMWTPAEWNHHHLQYFVHQLSPGLIEESRVKLTDSIHAFTILSWNSSHNADLTLRLNPQIPNHLGYMNFDILNAVNQNNMRYAWWFYEAIVLTHNMRLYTFFAASFQFGGRSLESCHVATLHKAALSGIFITSLADCKYAKYPSWGLWETKRAPGRVPYLFNLSEWLVT